jgi:molybdopterin biosynthesis enzyme
VTRDQNGALAALFGRNRVTSDSVSTAVESHILQLRERFCGGLAAVAPLEMAVSAALGCVASDDVYVPVPDGIGDPDETAVLAPIVPMIGRGAALTPITQQALIDAGRARLSVHPQPRIVIVGVDGPDTASRVTALSSAVSLTGALALAVTADNGPALEDAIDDQLVRADLVVVCAAPGFEGRALAVVSHLGQIEQISTGIHLLPTLHYGQIGIDQTPVVLLPSSATAQLCAFELLIHPMIARLQGRTDGRALRIVSAILGSSAESAGLSASVVADSEIGPQSSAEQSTAKLLIRPGSVTVGASGDYSVEVQRANNPQSLSLVNCFVFAEAGQDLSSGGAVTVLPLLWWEA